MNFSRDLSRLDWSVLSASMHQEIMNRYAALICSYMHLAGDMRKISSILTVKWHRYVYSWWFTWFVLGRKALNRFIWWKQDNHNYDDSFHCNNFDLNVPSYCYVGRNSTESGSLWQHMVTHWERKRGEKYSKEWIEGYLLPTWARKITANISTECSSRQHSVETLASYFPHSSW